MKSDHSHLSACTEIVEPSGLIDFTVREETPSGIPGAELNMQPGYCYSQNPTT